MTVTDAMIVAGGRGTRLQPLTFTTPKPLLPFCGRPFLSGMIARLAQAGIERVLLVVGADTDPFDVVMADAAGRGVAVETVPEPSPLDTAGGVRNALSRVAGSFLVLNGDVLTDVDLATVTNAHERAEADATIVLARVEDTSSYGVCVRDGTRITAFVEKPPPGALPGQDTINAGTYVLEPEVLSAFPAGPLSFERTVFPQLVAQGGHIEGCVWDGVWADLGTPERYRHGTRLALSGTCRWPTVEEIPDRGQGIRVAEDAQVEDTATLRGPVLIGPGCVVGPGATVGPDTVLGVGSRVGRNANVRGTVTFDHVAIGADVSADGLLAGHGVRVARGARLGRGVVLGDGVHVGDNEVLRDDERRPPASR